MNCLTIFSGIFAMTKRRTTVLLKYKLQNMQSELLMIIVMIVAKNLVMNAKNAGASNSSANAQLIYADSL